jgi:hypothetical protein
MRLYLIAEPSQQLFNAPVEGPWRMWVGRVRNVETGRRRPSAPHRDCAQQARVGVGQPGRLPFDPEDHVFFTDHDAR